MGVAVIQAGDTTSSDREMTIGAAIVMYMLMLILVAGGAILGTGVAKLMFREEEA